VCLLRFSRYDRPDFCGVEEAMKVLEVSRLGLFKELLPDGTNWIRWGNRLTADEPVLPDRLSLTGVARTLSRIGTRKFDLIVLPAIHPEHTDDQPKYKAPLKSICQGLSRVPALPETLNLIALRPTRCVILDINDRRYLCSTTLRLFPRCALYFKRELVLDEPRDSVLARKVKPLPLILPDERRIPVACEKDIDLFFAGALSNDTRKKAVDEARSLVARGIRVVIPEEPMPYHDFMQALGRSWLVLSPEGHGWDCYRHYEACLAGSVPLINNPRYQRRVYLQDGTHCFYYDADRDSLAARVIELLADKQRLARMAEAGRRYVLANHTRSAVARYIMSELEKADLIGRTAPAPRLA
jgi:Glycosyl transferases group 1